MAIQTRTVLTPTGINLTTYVNDLLVTERRRGFDGTINLPDLRDLAKAVVHERGVLDLTNVQVPP